MLQADISGVVGVENIPRRAICLFFHNRKGGVQFGIDAKARIDVVALKKIAHTLAIEITGQLGQVPRLMAEPRQSAGNIQWGATDIARQGYVAGGAVVALNDKQIVQGIATT